MNRKPYLSLLAGAGIAAIFGLAVALPARAQDDPPKAHAHIIIKGPNGVEEHDIDIDPSQIDPSGDGNHIVIMKAGPDGQFFSFSGSPTELGLLGGAGGMKVIGPGGMPIAMNGGLEIIDPARSYIHSLIKRDDVRSHLLITSKQREAMEAMENGQQQAMQTQIKESTQSLTSDLKSKSPEELKQYMTERAKKMQEQMKTMASERDQKLAAILTPKQFARLKELDLQWRGPLAMGVKDVADQAKLTKEQSPQVIDLLKQYRQEVAKQLNFGPRNIVFNGKPGGAAPAPPPAGDAKTPPATPAEMQIRLEKAKKEIEKARKSLGDKALKGVADEQRAQWATLTGKTFQFRTYN